MNEGAGGRAKSVRSTDVHLHELGIWRGSRLIVNKNRDAVAVKDVSKEIVPTVKLKHILLGDITDVRCALPTIPRYCPSFLLHPTSDHSLLCPLSTSRACG